MVARQLAFKGLGLCLLGGTLLVGLAPGCGRDENGPSNTSSTTATSVTTSDATTSSGSDGGMGGMGGGGGSANTGGTGGMGGMGGGSANTGGMGGAGGGECAVVEDCPAPANECTLATCENGQCGTAFVDQGTAVADQITGDCNIVQCDGAGSSEDAADDNDLPDDANPCTTEGCDMGQVTTGIVNAGTSCGVSLICDGNGQCVGCVTEADCPGSNSECAQKTCTMGVCGVNFAANGTLLAQQTPADCKTDVCDGQGGTTTVTNNNDLPIDNVDCTQDLCSAGMIQHPPMAMGTSCDDGGGSICDAVGVCVPCAAPTECPGQDTACSTRTCIAGQCGVSQTAAGTPVAGQAVGDCLLLTCNGMGGTTTSNDDNDVPVDGVTCTQDLCTAGVPSNPPAAVGTVCAQNGGRVCTSAGVCSEVVTTLRVGSGAAALTSASTALFVDVRFISDGSAVPLPLNPVPLPIAAVGGNLPITLSGTSTLEGLLSRSANNSYIVFGGYGVAPGTLSVATTTSATVNRVIARIDALANVNTTTALTAAFSGSNIRSAATVDGSAFWAGGNASSAANAGVQYATLGQTTSTQVLATPGNLRAVFIDGGQLYGTSGSANFTSIFSVGSGLPTTTGQAATILTGLPTLNASPCQFLFFDLVAGGVGPDTVYIADDRALASGGGIQKYTFNGATWTLAQVLSTGFTTGVRGLTGYVSNGAVVLVATTTEASANFLMKYIDDGSGVGTAVQLAQAPTNTVFRGTTLAPQ